MLSWNCCALVTRPFDDVEARDEALGQHGALPRGEVAQEREPELAALLGVELRGDDVVARDDRAELDACTSVTPSASAGSAGTQ